MIILSYEGNMFLCMQNIYRRMRNSILNIFLSFIVWQKADQISWGDGHKNFQIFTQVHQRYKVGKAICGDIAAVYGKENSKFW